MFVKINTLLKESLENVIKIKYLVDFWNIYIFLNFWQKIFKTLKISMWIFIFRL